MIAPPALRVVDVFRAHWAEYLREHSVPVFQQKAIRRLLACRTPALGGHIWRCLSAPLKNPSKVTGLKTASPAMGVAGLA